MNGGINNIACGIIKMAYLQRNVNISLVDQKKDRIGIRIVTKCTTVEGER